MVIVLKRALVGLVLVGSGEVGWGQLVTSFEEDAGGECLRPGGVSVVRVQEHATAGEWALKCTVPGKDQDSWPGLSFVPSSPDLRTLQLLALDVYNASAKASQLSWRIDDLDGKKHFGSGIKLPPRTATKAELYLRGLDAHVDMARVKQIFLYVRMPREDVILFLDNLRFAETSDMFTPLVYEETAPKLSLSDTERKRGYVLFSRHWLDVVFPGSRPRPGERADGLQAFAAPGEYEPVTVSIHPLQDLEQAAITVSALTSGEATIGANSVAVYPVRCLNKRVTYSSTKYVKDMPVMLERRARTRIKAGTSKRFWLDLRVPIDCSPGIYTGTVTFSAQGVPSAVLPLRLRVLPFRLREPENQILGEYYRGPQLARTEPQEREFLTRDLEDMRKHGMTSIGLCMGCPTQQATIADGKVELNLSGASLYEHCLDTYRDLGFPAPIVQLSDSGQSFAAQCKVAFGSPEYALAYTAFWRAFQQLARQRGWPEVIVQPVDEPGWKDQEAKDRNVTLLKLGKSVAGLRTEQDGPGDGYFHDRAGPFSDVWNYNGGIASDAIVQGARKAGRLVMLYNCDVESYRPEVGRYVAGFFQERANIDGYNWAYMSWRGSPYDDLDHKTGTWMHVYPAYQGEVGGPSTGWQGAREGVDDLRYLHTLTWAAERAVAAGNLDARNAAQQGRRTLASLLGTLHYSPRVRNTARWTQSRTAEGTQFISGTLKVPNGWDFETYDVARWQIAESIWAILAALGDAPAPERPGTSIEAPPAGELLSGVRWRQTAVSDVAGGGTVELSIPRLSGRTTVDGRLDESVWKSTPVVTDFRLHKGGTPKQQTRVRIFADDQGLNVAFECDEEYMGQITATITEPGGPVWQDDCVEIFIDANRDRKSFYQIVVNSLGVSATACDPGGDWQPSVTAAAVRGDATWSAEVRIPLADINLAGSTFGLNFCRERRPTEVMELSCWSPTGGRFGQPDKFGTAHLGTPYLRNVHLGAARIGPHEFRATVGNPSAKACTGRLVLEWHRGSDEVKRVSSERLTFRPGQVRDLMLPYTVAGGGAELEAEARFVDGTDGRVIATQRLSQQILPPVTLTRVPALVFAGEASHPVALAIAVEPAWRAQVNLGVVLRNGQNTVCGRTVLHEAAGDTISAALDLSSIPAGAYRLEATLRRTDSSEAVGRAVKVIHVVRGPFGR